MDYRGKKMKQNKSNFYIKKTIYEQSGFKIKTTKYPGFYGVVNYICKCGSKETCSLRIFIRNAECKKCNSTRVCKIDNNRIDNYIKNKNIERIGNYIPNSNFKIEFRCKLDGCKWETYSNNILRGSGCPRCSKVERLNNTAVDFRVKSMNILRIGDFISVNKRMTFKCLNNNCEHIWTTIGTNVLNQKTGCPKCNKIEKYTKKDINKKLLKRNIQIKGKYSGMKNTTSFICSLDRNIWITTPDNICNHKTGCPQCSKGRSERNIGDLIKLHIKYSLLKSHKKIYINDNLYLPDYYLEINKKVVIIEYNGEQHYKPVCFGNISIKRAKENLKKQKKRDRKLRKYYKNNNITLLEIPYTWKEEKIIKELQKLNSMGS